jgi:Fuc2NAc and GlcNAc transferase
MTLPSYTQYLLQMIYFAIGFSGAWFMSRFAYRFGLLDIPNDRSSHNLPTPRGGGVGVLGAFILSALLTGTAFIVWIPATFISLVSFFDDKLDLSPRTRLLFQFSAAALVVLPFLTSLDVILLLKIALFIFFLLFIVGTANFYNFMDGVNGIAGITGFIAFGLLAAFAAISGMDAAAITLPLAVAVACLGFLPFNIPNAAVFMGDVGSILLGFLFALLTVLNSHSLSDFLIRCGFLSTFYADALVTLYVRRRDGEKLSQAHRRHFYQLLANQMKIPHWKVSVGYGICQLLVGILLIMVNSYGLIPLIILIAALGSFFFVFSIRLRLRIEN